MFYASTILVSSRGTLSRASTNYYLLFLFGTFVVFAFIASGPYRRRTITLFPTILWIVVAPTLVFFALELLPFRFPISMTNPTTNVSSDRGAAGSMGFGVRR